MRMLIATAFLLGSVVAAAQDAPPKPVSIAVELLGDRGDGIVARVFFRFANPRAITDAGLFLEGSFTQPGQVPRSFRIAVPRKKDRFVWNSSLARNGKVVRLTRWSVLPDQRNETSMLHTFAVGPAEIDVRLVLEGDHGRPPRLIAEAAQTFTLAKTHHALAAEVEEVVEEEIPVEPAGPVTVRAPRRNESGLYLVSVDVLPPVKRVEFRVGDKRILIRHAPPYSAELDLGDSPAGVVVRAIGYEAAGRYVAADDFVMGDSDVTTPASR